MDKDVKKLKEKTFTEGVEDSRQVLDKEEQEKQFNPLKLRL